MILKLIFNTRAKLYELPCVATEGRPPPQKKLAEAGCGVLLRRVLAARGCADPPPRKRAAGRGHAAD